MKLAIFDLDGTLFNTVPVNYGAYKEALERYGFSIDYDYYKKECNGKNYMEFIPQIVGDSGSMVEEIHCQKVENYHKYLDKAIPNCNLLQMAMILKKSCYTAIVTTASKKNTFQLLKHFKCIDYFDAVFTGEDYENCKPDPEGFFLAMNFFGVKKNDTIIFEDSDEGIEAARRSGADYCVVMRYR